MATCFSMSFKIKASLSIGFTSIQIGLQPSFSIIKYICSSCQCAVFSCLHNSCNCLCCLGFFIRLQVSGNLQASNRKVERKKTLQGLYKLLYYKIAKIMFSKGTPLKLGFSALPPQNVKPSTNMEKYFQENKPSLY